MTRKRTLLDALADKVIELVDAYDVTNLFPHMKPKKEPVKLKVIDVVDVTKDVKP